VLALIKLEIAIFSKYPKCTFWLVWDTCRQSVDCLSEFAVFSHGNCIDCKHGYFRITRIINSSVVHFCTEYARGRFSSGLTTKCHYRFLRTIYSIWINSFRSQIQSKVYTVRCWFDFSNRMFRVKTTHRIYYSTISGICQYGSKNFRRQNINVPFDAKGTENDGVAGVPQRISPSLILSGCAQSRACARHFRMSDGSFLWKLQITPNPMYICDFVAHIVCFSFSAEEVEDYWINRFLYIISIYFRYFSLLIPSDNYQGINDDIVQATGFGVIRTDRRGELAVILKWRAQALLCAQPLKIIDSETHRDCAATPMFSLPFASKGRLNEALL
jgi:hypothetical protein